MAENFYTILTTTGKAKIANSAALGTKVNFKTLKVGDGNGAYYEPTENQTSLINKVWEGNIGAVTVDETNSNWIVTETTIPASDGGFFIREAGIFDEDGDLIAIAKMAATYKPVAAEGTTKDLSIRIILEVSNLSSITLKVDPNVIIATKKDIQIISNSISSIGTQLSDMVYQIAGGTATALTLTIRGSLVNGYPITFIASANNGGAATTINGKKLYKPSTTTSPNLISGKAYTVWYNSTGDCFFIKASAEGTALAKDVRKNATFSNDNDTGISGGLDLSLLIPGNLRAGVTIDGVTGANNVVDTTISSSAAVAANIRAGYKCYVNGALVTGTAAEKAATTYIPGTADQTIASGVITTGIQTIKGDSNLLGANIISGKSIFGVPGTHENIPRFVSGTTQTLYSSGRGWNVNATTMSPSGAKATCLHHGGTVTVTFDLYNGTGGSATAYGRIYVNGVARGTLRSNNTGSYVTWSEDITVEIGDLIEIYLQSYDTSLDAHIRSWSINCSNVTNYATFA